MVMAFSAHRLCEILQVWKLTRLRRGRKVCSQLVELVRQTGVPFRLGCLRCGLQIGGDLRRHLLVFSRIRFLQLLQGARQLRKLRKLAAVSPGRRSGTARVAGGAARRRHRVLQSADQQLLQVGI